jgi:hypothetical protein
MNVNEPYTVKEEGIICVCAACFPGNSIVALFPDLAGSKLSHGYCPGHAAEFLAGFKSLRKHFAKAGL